MLKLMLLPSQHPMPIDLKNETNRQIAKELCENPDIRRIARWGSGTLH